VALWNSGGSHARILLQEFANSPAFVAVEQADGQAYAFAVGLDDADKPFILCYFRYFINANMLFEDLCVPPDGQYATVDCQSVDKGSEVKCQEHDASQYKHHNKDPENGSFGAVGKQLDPHSEECQSPQEPEYVLLRLISEHKLVHQVFFGYTAKGIKMLA
jgi:hypothetical protein